MKVVEQAQKVVEAVLDASSDGIARVHEVKKALETAGFPLEHPIASTLENLGFVLEEDFVLREEDFGRHDSFESEVDHFYNLHSV